ncbi:protein of unknown function [Candidatus Filomicrobium marinum]|nr:protein of unknown function [Candidatus Filomicrobium marinum]
MKAAVRSARVLLPRSSNNDRIRFGGPLTGRQNGASGPGVFGFSEERDIASGSQSQ